MVECEATGLDSDRTSVRMGKNPGGTAHYQNISGNGTLSIRYCCRFDMSEAMYHPERRLPVEADARSVFRGI